LELFLEVGLLRWHLVGFGGNRELEGTRRGGKREVHLALMKNADLQ
jgi:hypothetical protein